MNHTGRVPAPSTCENPEPTTDGWRTLAWWFRDSSSGQIVLGEAPNPAMVIVQATAAVRWLGVLPERRRELGWIRLGAFVVWSADELLRGTTPFRRLIGAVVLGSQLRRLAR